MKSRENSLVHLLNRNIEGCFISINLLGEVWYMSAHYSPVSSTLVSIIQIFSIWSPCSSEWNRHMQKGAIRKKQCCCAPHGHFMGPHWYLSDALNKWLIATIEGNLKNPREIKSLKLFGRTTLISLWVLWNIALLCIHISTNHLFQMYPERLKKQKIKSNKIRSSNTLID